MKAWGFKELGSWRQEAGEAWRARERPGPVQRALAEDRETGSTGRLLSTGTRKQQINRAEKGVSNGNVYTSPL